MSEIETAVNSLRAMDLPKGAESLLSTILSKAGTLETEQDKLKKALDKREDDNKGYRDTIKTLTDERDDLKGQLPKDGTVSVPKADAAALESYKAIGTPDELKAAKGEASTLKRAALISDAAGKAYNLKALGAHLPEGATLEPKKITQDGKETTVYEVIEGEKRTGLEDWVKGKETELDYVQFRVAEPGKPPVYTGRGNPGGSVADPVESYNQQTYGTKK